MADEPRIPVTTRPTKSGKPRKGAKKAKVAGAKRTQSGLHLTHASPGTYAMASPDTVKAFQQAVQAIEYGYDAQTGRPADQDVIGQAREEVQEIARQAQQETDDDSQLGVATQTVSNAIERAQFLNATDPEQAGALLAAAQLHVDETRLAADEANDPRMPALGAALARTFSQLTPGKNALTPSNRFLVDFIFQ
jgi:hypothetical protein